MDAKIEVLLVEDDPNDAQLVEIMLHETRLADFEVSRAGRLEEAIGYLRGDSRFDVVLLDLSLPDSDGIESVEQMRAAVPEIPVVVLTGRDDEETALRALRSGAEDYLFKGQGDGELIARSVRYAIERKRAEERLAYLAQYDQLTGLVNRTLFQDRLHQALARARASDSMVALMLVDLDHFKSINTTFGHAAGDELLKAVAGRVKGLVRESETVARMGADELAIVLEHLPDADRAALVAQDILDVLSEPFVLTGHEITTTASIGIAVWPLSEEDKLLENADTAIYRAKERGRDTYEFYSDEINLQVSERLALRKQLCHALKRKEFVLHYQPRVEVETGRIVGVEALLRWRHPNLGLILPEKFIALLEETRLIVAVGEWVLRTACQQLKDWQHSNPAILRVAVNLSVRQLLRRDLVCMVAGVLEETGLDPRCLELEVTESLLTEDIELSSRVLRELKSTVGEVSVSMDDFGTGYSSLLYLKSFPVDLLKIDQSFIQEVVTDPDSAQIVAAIIELAHDLRLEVVAEGVETEEQLTYLRQKGCDEAQGFYFSKPLPADEFARLLENGSPWQGASS